MKTLPRLLIVSAVVGAGATVPTQSRGTAWLKRGCGVLVILGGLWLLYTAA